MNFNIDPVLLNIGNFEIRYYAIFFFIAVVGNLLGFQNINKKLKINVDNLFFGLLISSLIGGRLFYLLINQVSDFATNPLIFFTSKHLGLSSFGVLTFCLTYIYFFSKKYQIDFSSLVDHLSVFSTFSVAMIRIGNFLNSEIIGIKTNVPWGITFLRVDSFSRHPVQLYEAFYLLLILFVSLYMIKKKSYLNMKGLLSSFVLTSYFTGRIFLESLKEYTSSMMYGPLSTLQWLCLLFIVYGAYSFVKSLKSKQKIV